MAGVFLLALGMGGCVIREQQSASKTAETEALLDKLIRLPKKGFMFGHQDDPVYGIRWDGDENRSDVKSVCGDYPAVMAFDLGRIEREIVNKQWMNKEEFMEMFALTQSLPGVFAVNISIFVGYKLYKVGGSLVCALATILPSFVIMMLIAMFFAQFQDNEVMIRIFNGIRPAVVALILFPCISAVRALKLKYFQLVAPAIATVLIWQFGLSPIYIVVAGIIGGLVYTLWLKEKIANKQV